MNLCKQIFIIALLLAPLTTVSKDDLVGQQALSIAETAVSAQPSIALVQPLNDLSIYTAQLMLRKAIKKQELVGSISQVATFGSMLLMVYAGSNVFRSYQEQKQEYLQSAKNFIEYINSRVTLNPPLSVEQFLNAPQPIAPSRGWISGAISGITYIPLMFLQQMPLFLASMCANAALNKLEQFKETPSLNWFMNRYIDTDRLWLQIFETAVTIDCDSALLENASLGHLQNRPEGMSGFSADALMGYLKTVSFTADIAQRDLSRQILNDLVSRLRAQYALLIAFCQLQPMDATSSARVNHQAIILMNSFNGMAQIINNLHEKDLLQSLVIAVNKIQYSERSMIYDAFPQLSYRQ